MIISIQDLHSISNTILPLFVGAIGYLLGGKQKMEAEIELKKSEARKSDNSVLVEQYKLLSEELTDTRKQLETLQQQRKEDAITIVQFLSLLCGDMQCLRRTSVEIEYTDGSIKIKRYSDQKPNDCIESV